MQRRTIQQVIDAAKSGEAVNPEEYRDTMLALHSMLAKSRMVLEIIADKAGNPKDLYYTTNALISIDQVRREREIWMNSIPADYNSKISQCADVPMARVQVMKESNA